MNGATWSQAVIEFCINLVEEVFGEALEYITRENAVHRVAEFNNAMYQQFGDDAPFTAVLNVRGVAFVAKERRFLPPQKQ